MGEAHQIEIEPMRRDDLGKVMAIERVSFTAPWSENLFLAELRNRDVATLLVAVPVSDRVRDIAGYIVYWRVADEMHILDLATAPAFRRRGIARQLVLAALQKAHGEGARRALLEVRVSNREAQKLYLDLGFTKGSLRREYYDRPHEDAVVMCLEDEAYRDLIATVEGTG